MVSKGGFWRVVEASIAVLIVAGGLLLIISSRGGEIKEDELSEEIRAALSEVAREQRTAILNDIDENDDVEDEIIEKIKEGIKNPAIEYIVVICDEGDNNCGSTAVAGLADKEEIYSEERLISTDPFVNSKKIRVYAWRK